MAEEANDLQVLVGVPFKSSRNAKVNTRKTRNCLPRLVNVITSGAHRENALLSNVQPSRRAIDAGAVGANNDIWRRIREDCIDKNFDVRGVDTSAMRLSLDFELMAKLDSGPVLGLSSVVVCFGNGLNH